jgi:hypothetical protein
MSSALVPLVSQLKETIRSKADEIRTDPRMVELINLHKALTTLETQCGLPTTSLSEMLALVDAEISIRPTEFYGLQPLDAAKRFLKKTGERGAGGQQIFTALKSGGLDLTATEQGTVRIGLSRSTLDVAKTAEDYYVMLEFLPHVKRGGKKKNKDEKDENSETKTAASPDSLSSEPKEEASE